jgi:hypothetical protein
VGSDVYRKEHFMLGNCDRLILLHIFCILVNYSYYVSKYTAMSKLEAYLTQLKHHID